MKWAIKLGGCAIVLLLALGLYTLMGIRHGWFGKLESAGNISGTALPSEVVSVRAETQRLSGKALGVSNPKQIVFGDLHVHTTHSTDAFIWSLPLLGGVGAHPVSDACDYARYCSAIDFWAITDHAEASTPRKWAEAKAGIRQCNAVSGDLNNPDLVSYLGFEWTQVGRTPQEHYGHKNVIFEGEDDDVVSSRAIAAGGVSLDTLRQGDVLPPTVALADWRNRQRYYDFQLFIKEIQATPLCDPELPSNELPTNCIEVAFTPGDLVERLEEQGLDYLLIPHGTSWGYYTPPGTTFDKQLLEEMRPDAQELMEIYSGHGNSEEYRPWRAVNLIETEDALIATCPEPSEGYTPPCWLAGEIIESRCLATCESAGECADRAAQTRNDAAMMGVPYHLTVKGENSEDWLDSGQCTDCFMPTFHHRPGTSAQYGLAITNFEDPENPNRFYWGFIASSDNHRARPGTGYKEIDRKLTTEMGGAISKKWAERLQPKEEPAPYSTPIPREKLLEMSGFGLTEVERQASFWLTGGLAAVHTEGRSRSQIWDAMKRKETYATSGPRILLWFDKTDGITSVPMGGRSETGEAPVFTARAVGSFKQLPGCPDFTANGLGAERVASLCQGECYNPSNERYLITRMEVVRIQPQSYEGEPVDDLIEDPWRVFDCPEDETGCSIEFTDPDYVGGARDTTYYVRAIQEETKAINGDALDCEFDENGKCVKVNLCRGDYRANWEEECLDVVEERAWSSPIYLTWPTE
ncbi:MAG: DUF3604 domain-containing protein [Pseudomonadota bacterium]